MAADGVIDFTVDKLVSFWKKSTVRRNFPVIFPVVSIVGSILQFLELVPTGYFSSSRNVLNVYFVKLSWAWTLGLLTPFLLILFSKSSLSRDASVLNRRLLSLVVATVVWYVSTWTFELIESYGACSEAEFTSKVACRRAGFHWDGYDISGHSFILPYSALLIMEETAPMAALKDASLSALLRTIVKLLYVALNLIVTIWLVMFTCTSIYFHTFIQKLLGTLCGLLGWYLTYGCWYLQSWSPGLPPLPRKQKRHS